jgi:hypothetical protein
MWQPSAISSKRKPHGSLKTIYGYTSFGEQFFLDVVFHVRKHRKQRLILKEKRLVVQLESVAKGDQLEVKIENGRQHIKIDASEMIK